MNSIYYSFLPFCPGQKSDLLVYSFSGFSQTLFKRRKKIFVVALYSLPSALYNHCRVHFSSLELSSLVQNFGCFDRVILQFFDTGE